MSFEYFSEDCESFEISLRVVLQSSASAGDTILSLLEKFVSSDGQSADLISDAHARRVYITPPLDRLRVEGGYGLRITVDGSRIINVAIIKTDALPATR